MSFWFRRKGKEEKTEESENDDEQDYHEENGTYDEDGAGKDLEDDIEAFFSPSENENKLLLANFNTMRKESLFCDAAFICNGVLFRAHKIILSAWSRWMRGFLTDSSSDDVLALDIFAPEAFRAVLDYMYGQPLHVTLDNADGIIKVTRRLELNKLEQTCWRYLLTILEPSNASYLHELADKYDCPPLKLGAWKLLQHQIPSPDRFPRKIDQSSLENGGKHLRGTGLMGPGDVHFPLGLKKSQIKYLEEEEAEHEEGEEGEEQKEEAEEGKGEMPSVFDDYEVDEEEEEYEGGEREDWEGATKKRLEGLPWDAPAQEVIRAWARRLKVVYSHCVPIEAVDDFNSTDLNRLKLSSSHALSSNVKLKSTPRNSNNNSSGAPSPTSLSLRNNNNNSSGNRNFQITKQKSTGGMGLRGGGGERGTGAGEKEGPAGGASPKSAPSLPAPLNKSSSLPLKPPTSPSSPPTAPLSQPLSAAPYRSARQIDWGEELRLFYTTMGMPEKVGGIKTILKTWTGREESMLSSLLEKYEESVPGELRRRLEGLIVLMENQTENSFDVRRKDH